MSKMGDREPVSPLRERRSATRSTRLRLARVWSSICLSALVTVAGTVAVDLRSVAAAAPSAHVVFVATDGRPGADGTRAHPLASINGAVSLLASKGGPGIVKVRAGSYAQRVMLRNRHGVTIRAYRAEHVILDGGSLTPPADRSAMVTIVDSSHVTVAGLDIRGYDTTSLDAMPIGIYVHGSSSHIALRGNHVHSMGNYNGTLGSFDLNAHGIAVYGDRARQPVTDLTIADNEVDHLALGASESVVVNGNVDGWRIVRNRIHDNNNIGIDAIGFEPTLTGPARYTRANRARHGMIADNVVTNIISRGNPSYYEDGGWCNCADGIYIDGGTHIRVLRNKLRADDIGIEVAAENPRGSADHVVVADNFVTRSAYVGIATGGYCNATRDCGGVRTGTAFANTFANNTLYANNQLADGSPEIVVQYYVTRTRFENNLVYATGVDHAVLGTVQGAQHDGMSTRPRLAGNLYYTSGGRAAAATFGVLGRTYVGWSAYRHATGLDRASHFAAPRLRHPSRGNLHLRRTSPAVDAGLRLPSGTVGPLDIDRQRRVRGGRIDIGADEKR
jgi:hypothetical protein